MFTIIGGDGKEYGPVTAEQLRAWIAAGRANLETKAKAAGSDEWRPLRDFPEFAGGPSVSTPPPLTHAPVRAEGPVDAASYAADLISRTRPLDAFSCLERSFNLWKQNFLPLVGVTLLVLILQGMLSMVPIIGSIAGLFLNGVFYGGLYYYYLGKMRGEPRTAGDVFAGFSRGFVPLMLATLMTTLLSFAAIIIAAGPVFLPLIRGAMSGAPMPTSLPEFGTLSILGLVLAAILAIYLSIAWAFTFALIIDHGLGAWTAMEVSRRVVTKQWFRVFIAGLLGGIAAMLGFIGFFIGILFTIPLAFGTILYAYEDLCNPPVLSSSDETTIV
ncbi:MAG: GYF domain-containing protein [Opitutus sp.]